MPTADQEELVVALARATVTAVDPETARYFDADAEAYFDDPSKALAATGPDVPLGSGIEVFVAGLTPVALYLAQKVIDNVTEVTVSHLGGRVRRLWARRKGTATAEGADGLRALPPVSEAQADEIHRLVVGSAEARGVATETAHELARVILSHLPRTGPAAG